jgi:tetratricopeptide (TPR) repeat protein
MSHYSEDDLHRYESDPEHHPEGEKIRAHLAECESCRVVLRDIAAVDAALRSSDFLAMRQRAEMASRTAEEDEEAAALLSEIIDNPPLFAYRSVSSKAEYQTAGVARALCDKADKERYKRPGFALLLARHAERIADALPRTHYLGVGVHRLRCRAARMCAEAYRALGEYPKALTALDRAERAGGLLPDTGFDLAVVKVTRAAVLREAERVEEAQQLAAEAAEAFAFYGDKLYWLSAKNLEASILYARCELRRAIALWIELLPTADEIPDEFLAGAMRHNIGKGYLDLGDTTSAVPFLNQSLRAFEKLGKETAIVRARWSLAKAHVVRGNYPEGAKRLRVVTAECDRLGMSVESLLVQLDIAEALFAGGREKEAREVCKDLRKAFRAKDLMNAAMQALAYLRDRAVRRELAIPDVRYVRDFVERLGRSPHLTFAPPPEAS